MSRAPAGTTTADGSAVVKKPDVATTDKGIGGFAPAKINLALHVTGQRADGYHLLDSLVGFAGLGDQITATPADGLSLTVSGPFAQGVPLDDSNLVLRAARVLQQARGVTRGATLRLTKSLPHAAGIGSASSDAAATLRLLSDLWSVPPLSADDPAVLTLGADVPVCLGGPRPQLMSGIGEVLCPAPALPEAALVLVNPRVAVPTAAVFKAMTRRSNPAMAPLPKGCDLAAFAAWLAQGRNDMEAAAITIAPAIGTALALLRQMPGVLVARMSGSGATCFALVRDMGTARQIARAIQLRQMNCWVAPAPLLA